MTGGAETNGRRGRDGGRWVRAGAWALVGVVGVMAAVGAVGSHLGADAVAAEGIVDVENQDAGRPQRFHDMFHTFGVGTLWERERRDTKSPRRVALTVNGSSYELEVQPDRAAFPKGLKSYVMDRHGKHELHIDTSRHVHGHVVGYPDSDVRLYLNQGHATGHMRLNHTHVYFMEPAHRHLDEYARDRSRRAVVVYRPEDMREDALPQDFCGVTHHGHDHDSHRHAHNHDHSDANNSEAAKLFKGPRPRSAQRVRRDSPTPSSSNTCIMRVVGDSVFVAHNGGEEEATQQMVAFIRAADSNLRPTEWGNNLTGLGVAVSETVVYADSASDPYKLSNWQQGSTTESSHLLSAFSADTDNAGFCLAHLFTNYDFEGGVLGLANVGEPKPSGGLCAKLSSNDMVLNTGLTTEINFGVQQPFLLLSLVTTHEIGHNWGSGHDPLKSTTCNPAEEDGGSYLMFATSVDGSQPNHFLFSPCSKESISLVLEHSSTDCFTREPGGGCGDFIVDPAGLDGIPGTQDDEECDAGAEGDTCCTPECKLASGAACSDGNAVCCNNCQFDPELVCFKSFTMDKQCRMTSKCGDNGNTNATVCPKAGYKPVGTICLSLGECVKAQDPNDRCRPFCQRFAAEACKCPDKEDACRLCCIHNNATTATPYCPRYFRWQTLYNTDEGMNETACFPTASSGQPVTNSTAREDPLTPFAPAGGEQPTCKPAYTVMSSPEYDFVFNGDSGPAETPTADNLIKSAGSFCDGGRCGDTGECIQDDSFKDIVNFFQTLSSQQLCKWVLGLAYSSTEKKCYCHYVIYTPPYFCPTRSHPFSSLLCTPPPPPHQTSSLSAVFIGVVTWGKSNIIATCMLGTLLIWIPMSLCITYYDNKNVR